MAAAILLKETTTADQQTRDQAGIRIETQMQAEAQRSGLPLVIRNNAASECRKAAADSLHDARCTKEKEATENYWK